MKPYIVLALLLLYSFPIFCQSDQGFQVSVEKGCGCPPPPHGPPGEEGPPGPKGPKGDDGPQGQAVPYPDPDGFSATKLTNQFLSDQEFITNWNDASPGSYNTGDFDPVGGIYTVPADGIYSVSATLACIPDGNSNYDLETVPRMVLIDDLTAIEYESVPFPTIPSAPGVPTTLLVQIKKTIQLPAGAQIRLYYRSFIPNSFFNLLSSEIPTFSIERVN